MVIWELINILSGVLSNSETLYAKNPNYTRTMGFQELKPSLLGIYLGWWGGGLPVNLYVKDNLVSSFSSIFGKALCSGCQGGKFEVGNFDCLDDGGIELSL